MKVQIKALMNKKVFKSGVYSIHADHPTCKRIDEIAIGFEAMCDCIKVLVEAGYQVTIASEDHEK